MRALAALLVVAACASSAHNSPPLDAGLPDDDASGGGGSSDAGQTACTPAPLTGVTPEQWFWVPVPGSACGNGTQAGFAINTTAKSKDVVIYLMGGGGCYSAQTCGGAQPTAANLDGYNASKAATELGFFQAGSIFDRNSTSNPLRDATFIFVPYCTGDFHSGNTVAPYGTRHVGFANITAYLAQLAPAYCDASRIVLAGSSAGGFGSVFNYEHVQQAFPQAPIDLIDDSGPPLRQITSQWQTQLRTAWGQTANIPAGCTGCDQAWHNFLPFLSAKHPQQRFSVISSLQDYSIGQFFNFTPSTYQTAINDLADNVIAPLSNVRVFYIANNDHVWLNRNLQTIATNTISLATFLQRELDHTANFTSVRP
jgi:hypothetical protein